MVESETGKPEEKFRTITLIHDGVEEGPFEFQERQKLQVALTRGIEAFDIPPQQRQNLTLSFEGRPLNLSSTFLEAEIPDNAKLLIQVPSAGGGTLG